MNEFLQELNAKHAVIEDVAGKCRVMEHIPGGSLRFQSFDAFRNRYDHRTVSCGQDPKGQRLEMPLGTWWLKQPTRRQFNSIAFAPGQEIDGVYNLWRGFAVVPLPGEKHQPFLKFVHEDLCGGDASRFDYLLNWMARAVQYPGKPGEVAIVVRGERGSGKTTFARMFGKLFGDHFLDVSNEWWLGGNFHPQLRDCVALLLDEVALDKRHGDVLKRLIAEPSLVIETKGSDAEVVPNHTHVILTTSTSWLVPTAFTARRFFVLDVNEPRQDFAEPRQDFAAIHADLKEGGNSHLLHALQHRNISSFDPLEAP